MWSGYFRTIVDVGFKPGATDPLVIGCRQAGCDVIEILSRLGTMILAILLSIFSVYFSGRYECTRVIDGEVQAYIVIIPATVYIGAATAREY